MATLATFKEGKIYTMRVVSNSSLLVEWKCIKRTPKMATFVNVKDENEVMRRRINQGHGCEYVREGNYSMAPVLSADSEAEPQAQEEEVDYTEKLAEVSKCAARVAEAEEMIAAMKHELECAREVLAASKSLLATARRELLTVTQ